MMEQQIKPGELVWAFDYPTNPPYNICNASLLEYISQSGNEYQLKRTDNGAIVYFRFIAPYQVRKATKC